MMVTTTHEMPGKRIVKALGLVQGSSIRARHVGMDLTAAFKNITGGEITEYTKLMAESREQAIDRMCDQARELGANAVICTRLTTASMMQSAAEILAYGTAAVIEPLTPE